MYHAKCPGELCDENYVGESRTCIAERVKEHNGRDQKSHKFKHSRETGHERVKSSDFSIIYKNFNGNKRKRRIAESLLIKQLRTVLNINGKSVPLKLFNYFPLRCATEILTI